MRKKLKRVFYTLSLFSKIIYNNHFHQKINKRYKMFSLDATGYVFQIPHFFSIGSSVIASLNLDKINAIYNTFEAVVSQVEHHLPRRGKQMRNLQAFMIPVSFASTAISLGNCINVYNPSFIKDSFNWPFMGKFTFNMGGWIIGIGCFFGAMKVAIEATKYFNDQKKAADLIKNVPGNVYGKLEWGLPVMEQTNAALALIRTSLTIASFVLNHSSSTTLLFTAGMQGLTFINYSRQKWMHYKTNYNINTSIGLKSLAISFFIRIYPFSPLCEDKCAICLEEQPTSNFCEDHGFHDQCLIGAINSKITSIVKDSAIIVTYKNTEIGSTPISTPKYSITINKENIPNCPCCRKLPVCYDVEIEAKSITNDMHTISVNYTDSPAVPTH